MRKKVPLGFCAVQDGELIGKIHFNNLKVNRAFWIKEGNRIGNRSKFSHLLFGFFRSFVYFLLRNFAISFFFLLSSSVCIQCEKS